MSTNKFPGYSDSELKLLCKTCGAVWGKHEGQRGMCPINGDWANGWHASWKFQAMPIIEIPSKKFQSKECPCGINRAGCEYHR